MLSGIHIYKSSIDDLEHEYGKPQSVKEGQRYENRVRTYEWQNKATRLRVMGLAEKLSYASGWIISIDVWGKQAQAGLGITGAGLRLGDRLEDAKRIYGSRLKNGTPSGLGSEPLFGGLTASVTTGAESPALEIDSDKAGRITHLRLVDPCVPPCW
jgi:hypothetical protein